MVTRDNQTENAMEHVEVLLAELERSINRLTHKLNDYIQANGASPDLKKKTKKMVQKITKAQKKQ